MDMAKNVIRKLKLELEAGKANPAKVGKDLAPTGINLLAFCQKYNELTAGQQGLIIPAEITVFEDRSFAVQTKTPPTAFLLKRAAGIEKGAGRPGHEDRGHPDRGGPAKDRRDQMAGSEHHPDRTGRENDRRNRPSMGIQVVD